LLDGINEAMMTAVWGLDGRRSDQESDQGI
jgi:hypothetical protein